MYAVSSGYPGPNEASLRSLKTTAGGGISVPVTAATSDETVGTSTAVFVSSKSCSKLISTDEGSVTATISVVGSGTEGICKPSVVSVTVTVLMLSLFDRKASEYKGALFLNVGSGLSPRWKHSTLLRSKLPAISNAEVLPILFG